MNDFEIAAITLRVLIIRSVSKMMMVRPTIILHPLEKVEGGLTQVEHKALLGLGATVGRKVYVWTGRVLEREELLSLNFPKSGGKLGWGVWE
jgi:rod shape-determining protein MreB and related proteins